MSICTCCNDTIVKFVSVPLEDKINEVMQNQTNSLSLLQTVDENIEYCTGGGDIDLSLQPEPLPLSYNNKKRKQYTNKEKRILSYSKKSKKV